MIEITNGAAPDPTLPLPGTKGGLRRSRGTGVPTVAGIIGATLFASSVPTPLYDIYQARWHFSALTLTSIYAVYALAALGALLLVGRTSDEVGRRPMLAVGLAGLIVASAAFAAADATGWLFVARGVQGIATGIVLGTAGATLIDIDPGRDQTHAGLVNGVASAFGLAAGAPTAALLVQFGPAPRVLPFAVQAAILATLTVAILRLREPVGATSRPRLRPARPNVPSAVRGPFAIAALAVLASWSVAALLLSLGPRLAARLVSSTSALPGGWATLAFAGSAGLAQLVFHRLRNRTATAGGSLMLASGMGLTIASLPRSPAAFFVGLIATGAGFGVVFMGGLRALTAAAPSHLRATVMSAFYIVAYLSLSVPAVLAGLVVGRLGLIQTFRIFGLVVIGLALAAGIAAGHMQSSPRTPGTPEGDISTRNPDAGERGAPA